MKPILLVDFGSTYTKVTGVDLDKKIILGTAVSYTTIETDITIGLEKAVALLEADVGPLLWERKLGCSSAAGGLKMVAVGLVPELTSKAAKTAALSAGAKILKTYSYRLNEDELDEIEASNPDILLLSGGTDGGNEEVVLHNAELIAHGSGGYPVVYAGNKSVVTKVREIFHLSNKDLIVTGNVMPTMDQMAIGPVKEVIADLFLKRIVEAKGLSKAEAYLDNILMPTPTAVMTAAELLAKGCHGQRGIGDLLVVDMGGATTDIHSACEGDSVHVNTVLKGLKEPYINRTVEGDLGARYSLRALVESVGAEAIASQLQWAANILEETIELMEEHPESISEEGSQSWQLDQVSAMAAVALSVKRHSGTIAANYTPFGEIFEQVGKDLTGVSTVIGTGGPIIHNHDAKLLLSQVVYDEKQPMSLRPKAPDYYLDKTYIMAAMGILAISNPETALTILKREIVKL